MVRIDGGRFNPPSSHVHSIVTPNPTTAYFLRCCWHPQLIFHNSNSGIKFVLRRSTEHANPRLKAEQAQPATLCGDARFEICTEWLHSPHVYHIISAGMHFLSLGLRPFFNRTRKQAHRYSWFTSKRSRKDSSRRFRRKHSNIKRLQEFAFGHHQLLYISCSTQGTYFKEFSLIYI